MEEEVDARLVADSLIRAESEGDRGATCHGTAEARRMGRQCAPTTPNVEVTGARRRGRPGREAQDRQRAPRGQGALP
jgi:hypothetical protein